MGRAAAVVGRDRRRVRRALPPAGAALSRELRLAVGIAAASGERVASLRRCLDALAGGTRLPDRVLVVDQSGDPGLAAALAAAELPFAVERIGQPRLGLAASRNLALDRLEEDIVAVTDDDCVPSAGWLQAVAAAFAGSPVLAAVTGPVAPLPAEGDRTEAVSSRAGTRRLDFVGRPAPWHVGTGGNMAFRRSLLGSLRFDERLGVGSPGLAGEDVDLLDRLLAAGGRIRFEPSALVHHERQTPARRLESRYGYGYGVGAMVGLGLRRGDPLAALNLARWLTLRARLAGRRRAARDELRVLAGTVAGLAYAIARTR
jgi:GT2 family glycosyltransferase